MKTAPVGILTAGLTVANTIKIGAPRMVSGSMREAPELTGNINGESLCQTIAS